MPEDQYWIWSLEHQAWWKLHGWGYTTELQKAGIYDEREASKIIEDANIAVGESEVFNEILVPFTPFKKEQLKV